jgi:hypothetical protein
MALIQGLLQVTPDPNTVGGLTYKRAKADVAASQTDAAVVPAVAGKKIRVVSMVAKAGGTAGDTILPFNPCGWFETAVGEGLSVTTGAGSATGILVGYTEV